MQIKMKLKFLPVLYNTKKKIGNQNFKIWISIIILCLLLVLLYPIDRYNINIKATTTTVL